jgi:thiamine-monophosphate kinase
MRHPLSEDAFLTLIDEAFPENRGEDFVGRSDDCAVIEAPSRLLVSTDIFLEDAHFRRSYFTPYEIGWKALAVNVSDIAAMGGVPLGFSLALTSAPGLDEAFHQEMFSGMADLAGRHDITLSGGDLSKGSSLCLTITIWGRPHDRVLLRGACRAGDVLFTVGAFGLARAGLLSLEEHGRKAEKDFPTAVAAHLLPHPRVAEGLVLSSLPGVRGAMDLSDGLARDLPRFLMSRRGLSLGAELHFEAGDLHEEIRSYCAEKKLDPAAFALLGGEDYALLAAADAKSFPDVQRALPASQAIGRVAVEPGIKLNGRAFTETGFDHFTKSES